MVNAKENSSQRTCGRRRDTVGLIVEKATELFADVGYTQSTVREIAARVGMQSGSLYNHFSGKQQILERIIGRVGDEFISRLKRVTETECDSKTMLYYMFYEHLRIIHDYHVAVTVYFNEWKKLDESARIKITEQRKRYEEIFLYGLRRGAESEEFRDVDLQTVNLFALSALNWTYQWYKPCSSPSPEVIAGRYSDFLLNGLVKSQ